jgi:hypothetical protein
MFHTLQAYLSSTKNIVKHEMLQLWADAKAKAEAEAKAAAEERAAEKAAAEKAAADAKVVILKIFETKLPWAHTYVVRSTACMCHSMLHTYSICELCV